MLKRCFNAPVFRVLGKRRRDLEENLDKYLKLLQDLARKYNGRAYLFGSRIKGEALPSSDVDVLLVIPDNVDRLQVLHKARRLVPNTLIEIHVLNENDVEVFAKLVKELKPI